MAYLMHVHFMILQHNICHSFAVFIADNMRRTARMTVIFKVILSGETLQRNG